MNFEQSGTVIARIGKKKLFITDPDSKDVKHPEREIVLGDGTEDVFQLIPNPETERSVLMICGASGSGKSYFAKNYINEYKKIYPKNKIYVFSNLSSDPSIDTIKNLQRVNVKDPEFLDDEIELDDIKNSLVLFDDVECISSKPIKNKINAIADMCLEVGRHSRTTVLFLVHTACNGASTKKILNECHSITLFLKTLGGKALHYLLSSYLSLDGGQIKKLKRMKKFGRALTITKTYPQVALTDKKVYIVAEDDDDNK